MKGFVNELVARLGDWFVENKREFPWRQNPTAYQVWVSEVMLQQTQALRVIGYYERWMARFPTVEALAEASQAEVLKAWEGLGYYSRARNLHASAKEVVMRFGGKIPADGALLSSIKGLGPYTVGAILAFGFQQKQPAVDANVMRVLARLFEIGDDIGKAKTAALMRDKALSILPDEKPHIISEALIELGAEVCRKRPLCARCPIQTSCQSFKAGTQTEYPVKRQKVEYISLFREVAIIECRDRLLLRQGKEGIACTGLYEFPYFDCERSGLAVEEVQKRIFDTLGVQVDFESYLEEEKHSFTRYRVTLYPKFFVAKSLKRVDKHDWFTEDEIATLTFSSGHKRVLETFMACKES